MRKTIFAILFLGTLMFSFTNMEDPAFTTVKFPSLDELAITADLYDVESKKPAILLCHQAGYSRGEYREIAVKLNALGFYCMAIDQRSGKEVGGVINKTAEGAAKAKLGISYGDAEPDIKASIEYLNKIANRPIVLWGSSYSAALALKIGNENARIIAVMAFSPGEYIKGTNITEAVTGLTKPLFATSSKKEGVSVTSLIAGVDPANKTQFIPEGEGKHGSKALWTASQGHEEYWTAVEAFLAKL